jgi:hypothetical protein
MPKIAVVVVVVVVVAVVAAHRIAVIAETLRDSTYPSNHRIRLDSSNSLSTVRWVVPLTSIHMRTINQ